ncbi:MAG: hypothetical protein JWP85_2090 [Rhodoglobus sp.]|nr:hypothetical protein [Rhodoglobus sp.]
MTTTAEAIEAVQRLAQSVIDRMPHSDDHAPVYEDLDVVEKALRLLTPAVVLAATERARHASLGYDSAHDAEHAPEMLDASASYAHYVSAADRFGLLLTVEEVECWPPAWGESNWTPGALTRTTVKSVALGLAALDDLLARGVE